MISKEMFIAAYRDGFVKFVSEEPESNHIICDIGECSIYLAEFPKSPLPPEAYINNVPVDETMDMIFSELQEIGLRELIYEDYDIYFRCESFLSEKYPNLARAANEKRQVVKAASTDELIHELLSRKASLPDAALRHLLDNSGYIAYKLWATDDVAARLLDGGYEDTDANIDAVINTGLLKGLNDCTEGDWSIIDYAIMHTGGLTAKEEREDSVSASPWLVNARTSKFETMELFDKTVLFSDKRIDRSTVPDGLFIYSLRHGDDDSEPATIEEHVTVNHFGDILSDEEFSLTEDSEGSAKYLKIGEDDWGYLSDMMTIEEYLG